MSTEISIRDMLSPKLARVLERMSDKRPVLDAAGAALAGISVRSFREEGLRAVEWEELSPMTLAAKGGSGNIGIDTGALIHSILFEVGASQVEIGSDRPYAGFFNDGTSQMPARPFIPVVDGRLTDEAESEVRSAIEGVLRAAMR